MQVIQMNTNPTCKYSKPSTSFQVFFFNVNSSLSTRLPLDWVPSFPEQIKKHTHTHNTSRGCEKIYISVWSRKKWWADRHKGGSQPNRRGQAWMKGLIMWWHLLLGQKWSHVDILNEMIFLWIPVKYLDVNKSTEGSADKCLLASFMVKL